PNEEMNSLVARVLSLHGAERASLLLSVTEWPFGKCDLMAWCQVLNDFDSTLERILQEHGLTSTTGPLPLPANITRLEVLSILHWSRLVIENAFNRSQYSSMDRLYGLLGTSDLEILGATLHL
ncbi:hypothetical protein GQ42DRAFT_106584, partial [Ramicandelaber brevisporus]